MFKSGKSNLNSDVVQFTSFSSFSANCSTAVLHFASEMEMGTDFLCELLFLYGLCTILHSDFVLYYPCGLFLRIVDRKK